MDKPRLPELLAPAGSPQALCAAIEGGADAVYFGGSAFNARMRAQNFSGEELERSVALCHAYGVKAYLTLNTLYTDREEQALLAVADEAYRAGIDALIVADLGAAALLRARLPDLPLHASTQCSAHGTAAAKELARLGFCRVVPARELSETDIRTLVRESGLEVEVFIHGALCVSHSGQCLFSSLVGGRSGNRGACAQPCRLPDAKGKYPLSLKDLSLAAHVPALIDAGVASLKIEGRLKAPEYVREVTAVYRRLLDERRAATPQEQKRLAEAFSRSGFTDAYFKGRVGREMLGVRTEQDKKITQKVAPFEGITKKIPLSMSLEMKRERPLRLTLFDGKMRVTVEGEPPLPARNAPMRAEDVQKNLCRLGGTSYEAGQVEIDLDEGLMVPVSRLNALRREGLAALAPKGRALPELPSPAPARPMGERPGLPSARFEHSAQITRAAKAFFGLTYLPLHAYDPVADGVVIPPVVFDSEREAVLCALREAAARGARHALVGNLGHLSLAREAGLMPHGDFRLNLCNARALETVLSLGFTDALLSPELTLPQIRDIGGGCDCIVYGRVPLMLLEKCVGTEVGNCKSCAEGQNRLIDRRGESFPVLRLPPHRNILVNSRPTVMSDRQAELRAAGITAGHYIFTVESPREVDAVLTAYREGRALPGEKRRI